MSDRKNFINWLGDEQLLEEFNKQKFKFPAEKRDLYWWIKNSTLTDFKGYLEKVELSKTSSEKKRDAKKGAELVCEYGGWKVYHILTQEASSYYGRNTKWCISGSYFEGKQELFDMYKKRWGYEYYFVISPCDNKWCYFDATDDKYDEGVRGYFWDSRGKAMKLAITEIPTTIPREVLNSLPNFRRRFKEWIIQ